MTPALGMRIGRYELLQKLGAGGMGEVYRARDLDLGRDVALKFLPERFAADPDRLERFAREAKAASSLNHPNIVTIHEIGMQDGAPFIVMECINGHTLRDLMTGRPLKVKRILDLAVQTAEGLAKAHAAGIVHRDLKPENLMVTADDLVKILDFGLAKLRAPMSGSDDSGADPNAPTQAMPAPATRTSEGLVIGTVGYMSPEQAAGRPVDFRSDQFSFGTILYEMVAGRRAFKRDTPVQTLSAIIESDPEPLATISPSFPAPGRWVIERCLAKEPADRYASTADLAQDLRGVREHLSDVTPPPIRKGRRITQRWWPAAAGVLATAILLVAGVPPLRDAVLGRFQLLPLPAEKRIAVLPFRATNASEDDRRMCDGLQDYIVANLGRLERFQKSAWVVPSGEVRQSGVQSASTARRALGATLVVEGSLQRVADRLVVTVSLIDAVTLRQLRAIPIEVVPDQQSLLDRTVDALIRMLDLEMGSDARAVLQAGGTGVAEASTLYAQALGYAPYREARTALEKADQERDLERAIALFNQALERDPQYALAHAGLGEAYWRLFRLSKKEGHRELAEARARRALELDPLLSQAWVTLGMIHTGSGKAEEAVLDLQRALDRDPRNADAYRELANAYDLLGEKSEAEATYQKAIDLRPDYWLNHSRLAYYLLMTNRPAEAETAYQKALELVPENIRVWNSLGAAYLSQAKKDAARAAWQKSLTLTPNSTAASNLATLEFRERRFKEAALAYEQALRIDDRDYRVWRNLATSYLKVDPARAKETFARAAALAERERALDPLNPETHVDLADCYAQAGEADKARSSLAEAIRLGGDRRVVARKIGEVYEDMGQRTTALEWVGTAIRLGSPLNEIDQSTTLDKLRADPRYDATVKEAMAARQGAGK